MPMSNPGAGAAAAASAASAADSASKALTYRDQMAAAVVASGVTGFYDTYALANAAVGGLAANAVVEVFADENKGGRRSLYQKVSGALTWKSYADGPHSSGGGLGAAIRKVKGTMVMVGDSTTDDAAGRPGWQDAVNKEWKSSGGIFEGWTCNNIGQNGSELIGWVNSIGTGSSATATTTRASIWAAVNANPDIIIISLGINDIGTAARRSVEGQLAALRANLQTLVNFCLVNAPRACVWLRMPNPLANSPATFGEGWADATETRTYNGYVRTVYQEWIGQSDRVEVYDAHSALFGNYADLVGDPVDSYYGTNGALLSDSLHPSNLGFRRIVQQMAMQADPGYNRAPKFSVEPISIPKDAVWTGTLFCRSAAAGAVTSITQDFSVSPGNVLASASLADSSDENQPNSLRKKNIIEAAARTANLAVFRQLLGCAKLSKVHAYNWSNGTTYDLTNIVLSQFVTGSSPNYAQLTISSASSLAGLGNGPVTFYVTDDTAAPFARPRSTATSLTTTDRVMGVPYSGFTINSGFCYRKPHNSTPVISVYLVNQADGSYNVGVSFPAPGKLIGTFTFAAFGARALFVFDPTNYPGGAISLSTEWMLAKVTTGSIATEFSAVGADIILTA